jgi:hypothetical protein
MAKHYSKAGIDLMNRIERVRKEWHPMLKNVQLGALYVFGEEPEQVLKHQGYPAAAVIKIIGTKERAAGMDDALLVVDQYVYEGLTEAQRDAMIDHELYHLELVIDDKTDKPKFDSLGRHRLSVRKHDRQFGWFDEVAQRHGENSLEVIQAKSIIASTRQLYFPFYRPAQEAA